MNAGPKGPTGPQGAQGPEYTISPYMHKMSVSRDELGLPPRTAAVMDAEKKVVDFFSAANKTRHGLDAECPACQAAMIVRLRGRDERAFLGCSRYPQCSGSIDVPDQAQNEAKNWERQVMASGKTASMLPNRHSDVVDDEDIDEALGRGMPPGRLTEISGKSFSWEDGVFHTFKALRDVAVGSRLKIRRGHEFYFDGRTLLYFGAESFLPEMKGLLHTEWVRHLRVSEVREIAAYRAGIKKEEAMKEATDQVEAPENGIKARLARSMKKAPYRMARMRALTEGKKVLLSALRPRIKPAAFDMVEAFLDTDAGQGALIGAIGLAGPMAPKIGKNKHVQALCEEFLDEGVAKGFNQVLSLVAMIVEPALQSAIAEMPGVEAIADKVVPKRRKKRVASDVRVASREPVESVEDDTREERPKNALRAIPSR